MCRDREAHTEEGRKEKGAGHVAQWLTGENFLVTCLGGASVSRAGRVLLWCCIVSAGLNGVFRSAWIRMSVFSFLSFFSPAMRAHTTVDSGVKRSLYRGGRKVREGGGEGGGW